MREREVPGGHQVQDCRLALGCSTKSGRIPSGAGIRISALKGRPRKLRDPPESPALLIDELSPGVIKIAGPFLYVLMPVRL